MAETTPVKAPRAVSLTPRAMEALWRAVEALDVSDPKRLASVLVEIASEEAEQSSRFAIKVQVLYRALEPIAKPTTPKPKGQKPKPKGLPADIVPIKHVEVATFDIGAPPDPYFLLEVFGAQQLPRVLEAYSPKALKEAVEIVKERQPGTRPQGQAKTKLIEYIMTYVC